MTITYDEETPSEPSKPKIVYEERRAAPVKKSLWETIKEEAKPDIFNSDRAAYELGGKATDKLTSIGASPEVAAGGGYLTNLAAQTIPMFIGGGVGKTAEPAFESAGQRLMQSALKPDKAARTSGRAVTAVQTLLNEGINVTHGGADILRGKVDDLVGEVGKIIAKYPNATVDKQLVYDALGSSIEKALKQGTPQSDVAILNKAVMDFAQHPLLKNASEIPVQLAQELKQGIWRKLKDLSFGQGVVPSAEIAAQKAMGSGLRQGIENVIPEVGPINAKTKEFLDALKLVEARVGAEGNKNILGLGVLSPSMQNFVAWMLDRYPAGKSVLARYLYSHADPTVAGAVTGAAIGARSGQPPNQQ